MKRVFLNSSFFLLGVIFLFGILVRFVGLGANPVGLVDDEADKGYDAYSLIQTGKDQWGASWPLLAFKGFGDYRTPLYTYLTIPSVSFFGLTPFAVRFPSALFGALTILSTYGLVFELFKDKKHAISLALLSSLLLAISPWHIGLSRMAMEVTVSVFLVTLGMVFFLRGRRWPKNLLLSGLLFGLSVYMYPANILLVPWILILFFIFFRKQYLKTAWSWMILAVGLFLLFAVPTLLNNTASTVRARQVNFTNDTGMIDLLNEKRGACVQYFTPTICRVVFNKYYVYLERFSINYIEHFSPNLLGISGTPTQYSALPAGGLLYLVELPILLFGIFTVFELKNTAGIFVFLFLLGSALPDSITSDGHYGRFFVSLPSWQILIGIGLLRVVAFGKRYRWIPLLIVVLYIAECSSFAFEYATYFPYQYSSYSHYGYEELVHKIDLYKSKYDKVIVSGRVNDAKQYIFYLFYTQYSPQKFQEGKGIEKELDALGWVRVKKIDSISFLPSLPPIDAKTKVSEKTLLVGSPSEFPKQTYVPVQFVTKDKRGNILFQAVDIQDMVHCIQVICIQK